MKTLTSIRTALGALIETVPDQDIRRSAVALYGKLSKLPMRTILEKVPGNSITAQARACGVSRQTYYTWMKGERLPQPKQAERLSALTGYTIDDIRGSASPPAP